jgi:transposase-like protein
MMEHRCFHREVVMAATKAAKQRARSFRREGIYSSQLSTWRRQLKRGDLDATNLKARAHRKANAEVSAKRIAELEAEHRKLRRHVARAELIAEHKTQRGSWGWTSRAARATTQAN